MKSFRCAEQAGSFMSRNVFDLFFNSYKCDVSERINTEVFGV